MVGFPLAVYVSRAHAIRSLFLVPCSKKLQPPCSVWSLLELLIGPYGRQLHSPGARPLSWFPFSSSRQLFHCLLAASTQYLASLSVVGRTANCLLSAPIFLHRRQQARFLRRPLHMQPLVQRGPLLVFFPSFSSVFSLSFLLCGPSQVFSQSLSCLLLCSLLRIRCHRSVVVGRARHGYCRLQRAFFLFAVDCLSFKKLKKTLASFSYSPLSLSPSHPPLRPLSGTSFTARSSLYLKYGDFRLETTSEIAFPL